jgi:hypothetical protein
MICAQLKKQKSPALPEGTAGDGWVWCGAIICAQSSPVVELFIWIAA